MDFLNSRKLKILSLVGVFSIYILLITATIWHINKKLYSQLPENVSSSNLQIIDTSNELYSATAKDDYNAFQRNLRNYITSQDGYINQQVYIKDVKAPFRDGSQYTVTLDIPGLNQTGLVIVFDYANGNYGSFSIPAKSYVTTLYEQN